MPEMDDLISNNSPETCIEAVGVSPLFQRRDRQCDPATILVCCFLCASIATSAAQTANRRIDLDVASNSPISSIVVARVSFAETDNQCPEDRGQLRISGGTWHLTTPVTDDETQQYRLETSACQMDIAVRQQLRREGSWEPLLVPKQQCPSVPEKERRELQRQFIENLRTPRGAKPFHSGNGRSPDSGHQGAARMGQ
jgi:hypothetical protein